MKRFVIALSILVLSTLCICAASVQRIFDQPKTAHLTASIDMFCVPRPVEFQIAAGFFGDGVQIRTLQPGTSCTTGEFIREQGFSLTGQGFRYTYRSVPGRPPVETGGSLQTLRLPPGKYQLSVDGGNGAIVTLTMKISSSEASPRLPIDSRRGILEGTVRSQLTLGALPRGLKGCRVLVLDPGAPGLQVGKPVDTTDTVAGPARLFADGTTDSSGYFRLPLDPGPYKIIFWCAGYIPKTVGYTVQPGPNTPTFSYYDNEERPVKPGITLNPWQGGPTHDYLDFDREVQGTRGGEQKIDGVYYHHDHGFRIRYSLPGWKIYTGQEARTRSRADSTLYLEKPQKASVHVEIFPQALAGDFADKAQNLESYFQSIFENFQVLGREPAGSGDVQGQHVIFTGTREGTDFYWHYALFLRGREFYVINGYCALGLRDTEGPEIDTLIRSFRLTKPD